jgi:CubicO group peptidase (beta-lactamase class C family)
MAGQEASMARKNMCTLTLAAAALATFAGCGGKTGSAGSPVVAPGGVSANLQSVLTYVEGQMQECSIPGGSIAVVVNGKLTDQAGFGVKDTGGAPVDPSTIFQTAALSKVVVGVTALRLVEQGELDTTTPVTDYVPLTLATGFDASSVTVANLLAHTSGLPDLDTSDLSCAVGPGQLGAFFAGDTGVPLWAPPGAVWDYSQRGYAAAGWVIENASSQPFESAVAARVFGPAGMTTATYDPSVVMGSGDFALGHEVNPVSGALTTEQPGGYDCEATRPPDGVYASALDFAHFAETLLAGGGAMLTKASVTSLETGLVPDELYPGDQYAYGMYVHEGYKGLHMLRNDGDLHGYSASLLLVPDQGFAVVVLFDGYNRNTGCSTDDAAEYAASTYLDLQDVPGPDWQTPSSAWTPYLGTYVDPYVLGTIDVGLAGGSLVVTTTAYGTTTLTQQSATAFTGSFGNNLETVTFDPDANGPAGWFVTRLGVGRRQ